MISYAPLWETMKKRGITTYTLIKDYSFSRGTLDSLKQNRNITTATLNDLCEILSCQVQDVIQYIPGKWSLLVSMSRDFCLQISRISPPSQWQNAGRTLFQSGSAMSSEIRHTYLCCSLCCFFSWRISWQRISGYYYVIYIWLNQFEIV